MARNTVDIVVRYLVDEPTRARTEATTKALGNVDFAGGRTIGAALGTASEAAAQLTDNVRKVSTETDTMAARARDASGRFQKLGDGAALKPLTDEVNRAGDATDKAGDKARNAGGAFSKLGEVGKTALSFAAGNLLASGVGGFVDGLQNAIEKGSEFRAGVAELSAITGVAGAPLENLADKARSLAIEFGGSATGNLTAFKGILSKLGPDIASTPSALEQMTRAVNVLSAATGDDAAASMDALTTGLLQFQIPLGDANAAAAEMASQMNVLAAGAKFGAAEVPQVADAIKVAGVAASGAKVSFEETNAAIQALAAGGKVGAEAGTALRNVLGKLGEGRFLPADVQKELRGAGVDIQKLSDTALPFTDRLRELQKVSSDAALTTKLFGTENAAAASILIRSVDDQDKLRIAITGTNTATEQAAVNQNTFAAQLARGQAQITDAAIGAFQAVEPALKGALSLIGGFVSGALTGVKAFVDVLQTAAPMLIAITVAYGAYTIVTNTATIATKIATLAQGALNAIMALNPFVAVGIAVLALVAGYKLLSDAINVTAEEQLDEAKAEAELIAKKREENVATQAQIKGNQSLVDEYTKLGQKAKLTAAEQSRFNELQTRINTTYPGLIDNTKAFGDNLGSLQEQSRKSVDELGKLSAQLTELDKQTAQNRKTQLFLEVNVAAGDLSEIIDDRFGTFGILSDKGREINKEVEKFKADIFTEQDIVDVENKTQLFIKALSNFKVDASDEIALRNGIQKFSTTRVAALKGASGEEVKAAQDAADQVAEAAVPTPGKVEEQKSLLDQIAKVQGENAKIRAENLRQQITDDGQKELQALQDAQEEKLALLRSERTKVESIEKTSAAERKQLQDSFSEQILLVEAQGILKREELISKLAQRRVDTERKTAEEATRAQTEALQQQLQLAENSFAATGSLDAVRRAGALRLGILKQNNDAEIAELVANNVKVQAAQVELQRALLDGGLAAILSARRNLATAQREALTTDEGIQNALQLQGRAVVEQAEANALEVERVQIESDTDLARRTRDLTILEARITLQERLKEARGNKALELQAELDFLGAKRDAEQAYLRDTNTLVAASLAIREGMYQAYLDATNPDKTGELDNKKKALDKEEADLKSSFDRRELMYEDYLSKSAALEQRRRELGTASVNVFEAAQKGAVAGLEKMAERFGDKSAKAQEKYANLLSASVQNEKAIAAQRDEILNNSALQASAALAAYAVAGELTFKKFGLVVVDSAVQVLQAQIPVWVAGIFGTTVAQMGPFGIAVAAGLTATLYGLAAAAKAGLGRNMGEVNIQGPGTTKSDDIPRYLSLSESVVTAEGTLARGRYSSNEDALRWLNTTGRPLEEYFIPRIEKSLAEKFRRERYTASSGPAATRPDEVAHSSRVEAAIDRQTRKLQQENAELRRDVQELQAQFRHSTRVDVPPVPLRIDGDDMTGLLHIKQRESLLK